MSQRTVEQLEVLRQFATIRQIEYIDAIISEGSIRAAARKLEIYDTTIGQSINSLERKYESMSGENPRVLPIISDGMFANATSTLIGEDGKVKLQWVKAKQDEALKEQFVKEAIEQLSKKIEGLAPLVSKPTIIQENLATIYTLGDPHFGMYAWWQDAGDDFDLDIATKLTLGAVDRLVSCTPKSKIGILINLGDMFHADNQSNRTEKSGHQLDVDGRWAKVVMVGFDAMVHCILRMLEKHEVVIFRINKGNHDGHSSFALAVALKAWFKNDDRVQIDLSPSLFWYYKFGKNLIGSTHGDTVKGDSLPILMATDKPLEWGDTLYRTWIVGHIHHKVIKEYSGCTVEYVRTLASRDAWHQGMGYRAGRDMSAIVLDKEFGEIERHRCDVSMIE